MQTIDTKRFKKERSYYLVSGVRLNLAMMEMLLFLSELEASEIKYNPAFMSLAALQNRDLIEMKSTESGEIHSGLSLKGKSIIKELMK